MDNEGRNARRVLSIQSHVVHGYVGNKAAVFPLQLLGFEVDFINTVHFSNHTGYPLFKGTVMDGETLDTIIDGMVTNNLVDHSHLLTGYIGSESVLKSVVSVLSLLREKDPGTVYVCDPVLGDNGKLYTKPELVDIFVEEVIPLADIVTPNQFELELLTKQKVETDQDITKAISILHSKGPHTVVVTSVSKETEGEGGQAGDILVIASTTKKQDQGYHPQFKIRIPRLDSDFTGTGDLTAALLLAWCDTYPGRLQEAVLRSMSTVYKILQDTVKFNSSSSAKTQSKSVIKTPELRLVQNQGAIKSPSSSQIFVVEPL